MKQATIMNKRLTLIAVATFAGIITFASNVSADSDFNYTCKKAYVTVKSKTPCYVSTHGISVPGGHDATEAGANGGKEKGDEGGVNKEGPKDLKDKPKGGGFNNNGPKNINS
jgi:hypothetical protein